MPVDVFESKILVLYKAKEVQNAIFSVKMIKFSTKYGIGKYWLICLDALVQTYLAVAVHSFTNDITE